MVKQKGKTMARVTHKAICPACKGNGFVRVPYELAREEVHANCEVCKSQGEITLDEIDFIDQYSPSKSN